jgi:hypothetical protein
MDGCYTAPLSRLLKVDSNLIQMVSNLISGESSDFEDGFARIGCEARIHNRNLRELGYGISELLGEFDGCS